MHKILLYLGARQALLTLILSVVLFLPHSEVFAQGVSECTSEKISFVNSYDPKIPNTTCPTVAVCYIQRQSNVDKRPIINCYESGPNGRTVAAEKADLQKQNVLPLQAGAGGAAGGPATSGKGEPCTDGTANGIKTAIGCVPTEPRELVEGLLKFATYASGGIALLLMIFGALGLITAEGNPEAIKHAQEQFYSAIIGLLIIIFSVLLMQVIGVDILGLPGFGRRG